MPKIICAECKAIENVEEAPEAMARVLCSSCRAHGGSAKKAQPPRKTKRRTIPSKQHGTRVMLPIKCSNCGKLDTLDYVPKGGDIDDVLCKACAAEAFGASSEWARIERYKKNDARKDQDFEFHCDECGRKDLLPFKPQPDRIYLCTRCHHEHETPRHDRIAGRQKAVDGIFVRRTPPGSKED